MQFAYSNERIVSGVYQKFIVKDEFYGYLCKFTVFLSYILCRLRILPSKGNIDVMETYRALKLSLHLLEY